MLATAAEHIMIGAMLATSWLTGLLILGLSLSGAVGLAQEIVVLTVSGVIDPVIARYVVGGLEEAKALKAQALIIELNTPGGLDTAMREIVQGILNASVPVVVYVTPKGARAASAGVFITLAAHKAAMAPMTNIGAAHPVAIGGEMDPTMAEKAVNDAAAYIRAIASQRGRNVQWAEDAVRKSASITAEEALQQGVIDFIAADLDDLLRQLDGQTVQLGDETHTLYTHQAQLIRRGMSLPEQLLHQLADPTIAYILLTLGIYALIAAFYAGEPIVGTLGAILVLLAFVALGSLPLNWGGLALLVLGLALVVIDLNVQGYALSIVGAIAFVLGSLLLFRPFRLPEAAAPTLAVSPWAIGAMTAVLVGFFVIAVRGGWRAHRVPPAQLGHLVGEIGIAKTALNPYGTVYVRGEEWSAEAVEGPIPEGVRVRVVEARGLRLRVVAEPSPKKGE